MPTNIEAKFRCPELGSVESRAQVFADNGPTILCQTDTYFEVPDGRLKLREFPDAPAELIGYSRADAAATRPSQWRIVTIDDPDSLKEILLGTCGLKTVVDKKRTLYLIGQTRVHLDEVEGLGSFVEIEVVLGEGDDEATGQTIANDVCEKLGLGSLTLEPRSYSDLTLEQESLKIN